MDAMIWLVILVIMVVVEIATMGLTTIWFAGGALVAFLADVAGASRPVQIILFFVVSFILLFVTRPIAKRYFNKDRIKTNAESLIGGSAIVLEAIDNLQGTGKVTVNGLEWTARTTDNQQRIAKDSVVVIKAIQGVKLIVEEADATISSETIPEN